MGGLVAGINGAVVVAVFASELAGTFVIPRTVPATAAIFTEPDDALTSRISRESGLSHSHRHQSCPRAVIPLGRKLNTVQKKISNSPLSIITNAISRLQLKTSGIKAKIYQKLRLSCLFPKLLRPFAPMFLYFRCKLGLEDDRFMETPPCNATVCREPSIEDRVITRDRGVPNLDVMIEGQVSTMDDCFDDMRKVVYGTRVQAKLVDDESCENPRYQPLCQEEIDQNRVLLEQNCLSPK